MRSLIEGREKMNFSGLNLYCPSCGGILTILKHSRLEIKGIFITKVLCKSCQYSYLIPDPSEYDVTNTGVHVRCPGNNHDLLKVKRSNLPLLEIWSEDFCKNNSCYQSCIIIKHKDEFL